MARKVRPDQRRGAGVGAGGGQPGSNAMKGRSLVPRGYVYDKYYICMTNRTPKSRKKRISPTQGKVSTSSNFGSVYLRVFSV
jgi:hypothetical protein